MKSHCPLCLEDIPVINRIILISCHHEGCKICLSRWLVTEESRGSRLPTCPFCRTYLSEYDTVRVLGRQLKPPVIGSAAVEREGEDEEVDELSLQWLEANTKLCHGCGARIQRVDGCNSMRCNCGFHFCYNCGCPRRNNGELGQYLGRFRCEGNCEYVQSRRRYQEREREKEVDEFWSLDKRLGIVWLFLPNAKGLKLLSEVTRKEAVQQRRDVEVEREIKRRELKMFELV